MASRARGGLSRNGGAAGIDHASEAKVGFAGHIADYLAPADALVAILSVPVFHREIWLPDRP